MSLATPLIIRPTDYHVIPEELRNLDQWVVRRNKIPVDPRNGKLADSTDATTWGSFANAAGALNRGNWSGIGFVFSAEDPYVGIDFDHCIDVAGNLDPFVQHWLTWLNSYAEYSPSGTGIHVFIRATLDHAIKTRWCEVYDRERYFSVTGKHVPGTPDEINAAEAALNQLISELRPEPIAPTPTAPMSPPQLDDDEVIQKARNARNGTGFSALYDRGDTSAYDGDASRADAGLVGYVGFYTRDEAQIARIMRTSALYRDKYERTDYLPRTIAAALSHIQSQWGGAPSPARVIATGSLGDAKPAGMLDELAQLRAENERLAAEIALKDAELGRLRQLEARYEQDTIVLENETMLPLEKVFLLNEWRYVGYPGEEIEGPKRTNLGVSAAKTNCSPNRAGQAHAYLASQGYLLRRDYRNPETGNKVIDAAPGRPMEVREVLPKAEHLVKDAARKRFCPHCGSEHLEAWAHCKACDWQGPEWAILDQPPPAFEERMQGVPITDSVVGGTQEERGESGEPGGTVTEDIVSTDSVITPPSLESVVGQNLLLASQPRPVCHCSSCGYRVWSRGAEYWFCSNCGALAEATGP